MKSRLKILFRLFRRQTDGASAVEFAIIFPVMMALLLGSVSVGQAITVQRKITLLSRSLADIVAQSATISNQELDNLLNAAKLIVAPYSADPLSMSITSIFKDAGGSTKVDWSRGSAAAATGNAVTLPADQSIPTNGSVIKARVTYDYKVPFGERIIGDKLTLSSEIYMRPRVTHRITKS